MKPKLLVLELWGLGDLAMATPFLQAATARYNVTLVAKPFAQELQPRFWPEVTVLPWTAPWTHFRGKYRLHAWSWREIWQLRQRLKKEDFAAGASVRWDPRDPVVLKLCGVRERLGFARLGSGLFLTRSLPSPEALAHRYESWRIVGEALGLGLPRLDELKLPKSTQRTIVVHTGAAQPVRVWPLERCATIVQRLRALGHSVQVACDPNQCEWWRANGEHGVVAPRNVGELLITLDQAGLFVGNDSGPGHLAALVGLPTFTVFGPQLPEWFRPLHSDAEWVAGAPCPYKPCFDSCRFESPHCILKLSTEQVWQRLHVFVDRHLGHGRAVASDE